MDSKIIGWESEEEETEIIDEAFGGWAGGCLSWSDAKANLIDYQGPKSGPPIRKGEGSPTPLATGLILYHNILEL